MPLPSLYRQPLRKIILTAAIGEDANNQAGATRPLIDAYAEIHGYHRQHWHGAGYDNIPDYTRPPAWVKVQMLRKFLNAYDLLVWLDCDVVVQRGEFDVGEILTRTFGFQALAIEDREPNTGVWIVRGADPLAAEFLAAVDAQRDLYEHPVWEQEAVKRLLGYRRLDRPLDSLNPDWLRGTVLLPPETNDLTRSRPDAVLHHHAGFGRSQDARLRELEDDAHAQTFASR